MCSNWALTTILERDQGFGEQEPGKGMSDSITDSCLLLWSAPWPSLQAAEGLISGYKAVFHEHKAMLLGAVIPAAFMTISVYSFGRILGNGLFCVWTAGKAAAAG